MSENKKTSARNTRIQNLIYTIVVIVLLNIIAQYFFFRIDLTSEKRYSISKNSKEILRNLNEPVYIKIYLEGGLNIPFRKFQRTVKELLDEFIVYGGENIQYEFIDPFEDADEQMQQKILEEFSLKGINPTNIQNRERDGSVTEKIIIPGANIYYKNLEFPLNLILNNAGISGDQNLSNSESALEYNFISTIKNISNTKTEKIAFLEGHGEYTDPEIGDFMKSLANSFQIDRGSINKNPGVLDDYKMLIIAGPTEKFSEADKYVIDQYVMQGGKLIFLLNQVYVDFDSLRLGQSLAYPLDLNLDDLLFRYGVRLRSELIQDIQCNILPVNVALSTEKPQFQPAPWMYYPLISPLRNNPITQNLNMIWCRFASPIDTISARKEITKTPILLSSASNKNILTPTIINLQEIKQVPNENEFIFGNQLIGVMLEGEFESVFKNRMREEIIPGNFPASLEKSPKTKIAVISDADIIRNDVRYSPKGPLISPLGFDKYTNQTFGNKDFMLNLAQYMADDNNLLELRGRNFQLRLLDRKKISADRIKWQIINTVLPSVLTILFGLFYNYLRMRKYKVAM